MAKYIDVKIDKNLLDTHFDGYKLSLKPIECTSVEIPNEIYKAQPDFDQYSFVYAKLFTLHNHLHQDPWNLSSVYFVDKSFGVQKGYLNGDQPTITKVWEFAQNPPQKRGYLHTTLVFTSETMVICSDGAGMLYIVDTGNRNLDKSEWKLMFSGEILGEDKNFIITDARYEYINETHQIHCVLITIEPNIDNKSYDQVLHWIILIQSSDGSWGATEIDTLRGKDLHYCALEPGSKALYIASDSYFKFTNQEPEALPQLEVAKLYTWQQSNDDITITLGFDIADKKDLKIKTTSQKLEIRKSSEVILDINLSKVVDSDLTTWEVANNHLKVVLCKEEVGLMWAELVTGGDLRGEQIVDPALAEEIHEKLAHLCSDKVESGDPMTTLSSCSVEECDLSSSPVFGRYERESHSQTHTIGLSGYNFLFNVQLEANKPPGIVLRHDVDACLFEPEVQDWNIKHVGTLHAFGYVQASKQQKKFLTCAPDLSYAVIAESSQHIFLYRQRRGVDEGCQLRNRGTGVQINNIAEQQLIALPPDDVLGIFASNNMLFILKPKRLMVFFV